MCAGRAHLGVCGGLALLSSSFFTPQPLTHSLCSLLSHTQQQHTTLGGDEQCIALLRAIRAAVPAASDDAASTGKGSKGSSKGASNEVMLAIVEVTLSDDVRPALLCGRHMSDLTMLANFWEGRERTEAQLRALLAAAGWRLGRVVPTNGMLCVVEAWPA